VSGEEVVLQVPFNLYKEEKAEFVIGHVEAGDILIIKVESERSYYVYKLTIFPVEEGWNRSLFLTKIDGSTQLSFKAPISCDAGMSIECMSLNGCKGSITVQLARSSTIEHSSPMLSRCPKCGMPLEPGAKYCGYCGAKVA
jgi:hypothetical protein